MSIVPLEKVTLVGLSGDKPQVLSDLQDLGCLHIVPVVPEGETPIVSGPSSESREALKFLLSCPARQYQAKRSAEYCAEDVERQALDVQRRYLDLTDERDFLVQRIANLAPWGDFELPPLDEMAGQRLWFYQVPNGSMEDVAASGVRYEVIHRDARTSYVVVLAPEEPPTEAMPVERVHTGSRSKHELEDRLEEVELAIEDILAERSSLTRWCTLFARDLDRLEDAAARRHVAQQTLDTEPVFGLHAWAPVERLPELEAYAAEHGLALERAEPSAEDDPPTEMENHHGFDAGEELVNFYMTPGYRTWDPSSIVLISFAIFFGMILADAGYATIMALIMWRLWKRMGKTDGGRRFRIIFASLTGATFIYGVLVGSYFGVTPSPDSFPGKLKILDLTDPTTMMALSVIVGVVHIMLANIMNARRMGRDPAALAPVGWALFVAGAFGFGVGMGLDKPLLARLAGVVTVAGLALVVIFAGSGQRPLRRVMTGAMSLTRISGVFGDVLSYLRLFALGLATASLAMAFNDMASQIKGGLPGIGLFLAIVVLLIGHGLNFVLGIASGVIHGLRLNVIEFFNWGVTDEGRLFRPFRRKEGASWNP